MRETGDGNEHVQTFSANSEVVNLRLLVDVISAELSALAIFSRRHLIDH